MTYKFEKMSLNKPRNKSYYVSCAVYNTTVPSYLLYLHKFFV